MKVIPPIQITDAILHSSTVDEADYPVWSAGVAYAIGDRRIVTAGVHRVFERLVAGTTPKSPETDPTNWLDLGATNRWRMLAADGDYKTVGASPMIVELKPGRRVPALAMIGLDADAVKVELLDSTNAVVLTVEQNLITRITRSWYDYFFGAFGNRPYFVYLELFPITGATLRITLTKASGPVSAGALVLGTPVDLGGTKASPSFGIEDFSRNERNVYGDLITVRRRAVPRASLTTHLTAADIDRVRTTLTELRGRTAMYLGTTNDRSRLFGSLAVLGLVTEWDIVPLEGGQLADLTIDVEGL